MKRLAFLVSVCLLVLLVAVPVQAQPRLDTASITFLGPGVPVAQSSSSVWDQWVFYPNTGWWNTWFYDHPLNFNRWKEFALDMRVLSTNPVPEPVFVEVAINWSTPLYTSTGAVGPPLPPLDPILEQEFIGRHTVFAEQVFPGQMIPFSIEGRLPVPYNPEWVSIDVRPVVSPTINGLVELNFILRHDCVPEPATLGLVALSVAVLICRRSR